jgi:hypothetical protein
MPRRLTLRAEHLAELSTDDLASVAGGLPTSPCTGAYPTIWCGALVAAVVAAVTREVTTA